MTGNSFKDSPQASTADIPVRAASTVLVCRDGSAGLEVLMLQRHARSQVLAGAFVFPGGKVDPADAWDEGDGRLDQPASVLRERLAEPALAPTQAIALHVAAVREAFEECGLLIARDLQPATAREATRLAAEGSDFNELMATLGLRLDTLALQPFSRWVTPLQSLSAPGFRFDTRFFVLRAPEGQLPRHDDHETVLARWFEPREALAAYWAREVMLAAPQVMSLSHLSRFVTVDALLADARDRGPHTVRPATFEIDGVRGTAYPGDPLHEDAEAVMPGPKRLMMKEGRLEPAGGFEGFF